jgi:hypothetical protein
MLDIGIDSDNYLLSIFIIPVGLFVIIFFSIIFINSVAFRIKNPHIYNRLYVPFCINALAAIIALCLPSHKRSKQHYIGSGALCNYKTGGCACNLYAEHYNVYDRGAWGTGLNSEYLTDSVNFRKYLGTYDVGYEQIDITCKGDSIIVTKTSSEFIGPRGNDPKVLARQSYSLTRLRKSHVLTNSKYRFGFWYKDLTLAMGGIYNAFTY